MISTRTPAATALILAATLLTPPAALCGNPPTYVRKGTWQETVRASREAMAADYATGVARAGLTPGPWQILGPFTSDTPFTTAFPPELQLRSKKESKSDRAQWKEQRGWIDGSVIHLDPVPLSASYIRRTISAKRDTSVTAYLGSDDGIRVWLNDSLLFEHDVTRGAERNQEQVTFPLRRGNNTLLMKISNGGGPTGFVFSFSADDPEALWALLERDFTTQDERQQMSWEREDDIWSAEWTPRDYTSLTARYVDAYARIAAYASPGDSSRPIGYQTEAALVRAQRAYTNIRMMELSMVTRETADLVREITPSPSPVPRINGPKVLGVRPGSPVTYRISATGARPMTFTADRLPQGLTLDGERGLITGAISQGGKYVVTLLAKNELGESSRGFTIIVGDRIALTPPLGWNSWNCFGNDVNDAKIRAAADAMVSSGLADHGWTYINIDDCWMVRPDSKDPALGGTPRDASGAILTNKRFPDMASLSASVHDKGLQLGIYSSPGPLTCAGFTGSYGHEAQDARQFAAWGIDYLKYDWCSYGDIAKDQSLPELKKPYATMRAALDGVKRDIVYSLCQYGMGNVWEWGAEVGGNVWRTTGDITDTWQSMSGIGFRQAGLEKHAGPGTWNDPDMLVVGWVGWGSQLRPTRLKPFEQITHITLWSLLASPLLIGCDLTRLDEYTMKLLTNDEVLEVNQDPLGRQGRRVSQDSTLEVWAKELEDGSLAVGLFNRGETAANVTARWGALGIDGRRAVRDLWRQKDLGTVTSELTATVARHGAVLVKLTATE
jgi:alpha-galactosidase